jgi:hypothetical protein
MLGATVPTAKFAVTEVVALIATIQGLVVPVHVPAGEPVIVQPEKVELLAGVAVKVTDVPVVTIALHVVAPEFKPQLIRLLLEVEDPKTIPKPVPALETLKLETAFTLTVMGLAIRPILLEVVSV